jgi:hypothetical protein
MAEQSYTVEFDGYWREVNKENIPSQSGIYCVYECTYNESEGTVSIKKLIYIGESEDVKSRIAKHDKLTVWGKYIGPGNTICYNFAPVPSSIRDRVEAAVINHHKPPVNDEFKNNFPFDTTKMVLKGKIKFLNAKFTVYGS